MERRNREDAIGKRGTKDAKGTTKKSHEKEDIHQRRIMAEMIADWREKEKEKGSVEYGQRNGKHASSRNGLFGVHGHVYTGKRIQRSGVCTPEVWFYLYSKRTTHRKERVLRRTYTRNVSGRGPPWTDSLYTVYSALANTLDENE